MRVLASYSFSKHHHMCDMLLVCHPKNLQGMRALLIG